MKTLSIVLMSLVLAVVLLHGCSGNDSASRARQKTTTVAAPRVKADRPARTIPLAPSEAATAIGITAENYPLIDGSTSTLPLVQGIYFRMFRPIDRAEAEKGEIAVVGGEEPWGVMGYPGLPRQASQTVESYEMLVAGDVDLILVPDPSDDVKRHAATAGVDLEYTLIGAEALVFITSGKNPVNEITTEQLLNVYADATITNWADLGGKDGQLIALIRNKDSGSQAQMENLVLRGREIHPSFEKTNEERLRRTMSGMLASVGYDEYLNREDQNRYTLGYTLYYYLQRELAMVRKRSEGMAARGVYDIKPLAVDGVAPTPETILSKEYKLAMGYYAVIRQDEPADSPARKLVAWLLTDAGQQTVTAAGLGTLRPGVE